MATGKFDTDPNYDDDIEFIEDSDPVQGDPPGTDPQLTPLTGTANKIFQKIISSLAYLKNAVDNFSIERMTDTVLGIGRTATQQEAEDGTAHGTGGPVMTPLRSREGTESFIRSSDAQATTGQRGTSRRATQAQAEGLTDSSAYLTAALLAAALVHQNAQATTSKRGTVRLATESDVQNQQNTDRVATIDSLYRETPSPISSSDVTPTSANNGVTLNNVSIISVSGGNSSYFGPILYNNPPIVIEIDFGYISTGSNNKSVTIAVSGSITLSDWNWSVVAQSQHGTAVSGETVSASGSNLTIRLPANIGGTSYQATITGTYKGA